MKHTVDITPEGLKTEEGQERVKAALQAQETARLEALQQFRELMTAVNYHHGLQKLIDIIGQWYGDDEIAKELINDCFSAIKAIDEANQEVLNAAAGR